MAIGAGLAIAGGSILAGALGAKSAGKQAKAGVESAELGIAENRRQFDTTQESFRPFQEAGVSAINEQQALLGLSGRDAEAEAVARINESPGQKFMRDRAQKNLVRNAAATGALGGGNVKTALVKQGVGFAQQDIQNRIAQLGQIAGQGRAATTSVGDFGSRSTESTGRSLAQAGQSRQSGIAGRNQAVQSALSGVFTGLAQRGDFSGGAQIDPFGKINRPLGIAA